MVVEVHFFGEGWRRGGIDGYIVVSGNEKLPQISRRGIPGGGAQAPWLPTVPDSLSGRAAASFRGTTLWPASRKNRERERERKKEDISNERWNGDREENK